MTYLNVGDENSANRAALGKPPLFSSLNAERFAVWAMAILVCYATVKNFLDAAVRPFWYDEVCTWVIVRQPSLSSMWRALGHGADGQPPGFYVMEWLAAHLTANEQISFRIPSILGFACTIVCLFVYVKRRSGAVNAFLWSSIPLFSILFDTYAVEARPYCVVVACISLALVCYQRAPAPRWLILMGVSLMCAQAFHYYALIALFPFAASEAILFLRTRKLRLGVWLALACPLVPMLCFWPLLSQFRAYYGSHFWAVPTLRSAQWSYGWIFNTSFTRGVGLAAITGLAMLLAMLVAERRNVSAQPSRSGDLLPERILVLGFLALPFVGLALAELAHGGFTSRYALSAVLAFPLAADSLLPRIKARTLCVVATSLLVLALVLQEQKFWASYDGHFVSPADSVEKLAASAGHSNLPVVISDSLEFLPISHYATGEWRKRFVALADPPEAIAYIQTDTNDKAMQAMRDYTWLPAYDFPQFKVDHPDFLLYSSNAGYQTDWWVRKLFRDGYTMNRIAVRDPFHCIYLVRRSGATR